MSFYSKIQKTRKHEEQKFRVDHEVVFTAEILEILSLKGRIVEGKRLTEKEIAEKLGLKARQSIQQKLNTIKNENEWLTGERLNTAELDRKLRSKELLTPIMIGFFKRKSKEE